MKKRGSSEKKEKHKKRIFFIFKVVTSVILGFFPSFLFVVLFIQYGSPFSNYLKFLLDFNSSFLAWISAIIIGFFVYFIIGAIKTKKNFKKILKNKFLLVVLICCFVIVLVLISVQAYLYVNFVLKNDILVKLSADKENIFFTDNPSEDITFKISVTMNPFCSALCKYEFLDISSGKEIETGSFNIPSIFSKYKTYTFNNKNLVQGSQILNRFEVSCKSERNLLCYTKEKEVKRALLITLNYELTEEEKKFKENSKEEIVSVWQGIYSSRGKLNESISNINSINNSFSTEIFLHQTNNLSNIFLELNKSSSALKKLWEAQNFSELKEQLSYMSNKTLNFSMESEKLKLNINQNIFLYNNLIENINIDRITLEEISKINLTNYLCGRVNNIIVDFNYAIEQFKEKTDLLDKRIIIENISYEVNKLYNESINSQGILLCSLNENISQENLAKIEIVYQEIQIPEIFLKEPFPICCYLGKCERCCDNNCSKENYPIIFLHGHSFNKALPADYSFDSFAEIKEKLWEGNYIDAGAMVISPISEEKGLWGKVNAPITVTASYFFDTYKNGEGEEIIQSKTDSIDTYAIRLKGIVDLMKYRTKKDKVIIIAHSMGGLVTRRYVQIFGAEDVDKEILITVPNHGIEDKVRDYCAIFGPEVVCGEMNKDSVFINKLNNAQTEIPRAYNIIGIGCNMGKETGDGIVKNSSQYLDYATNYYLEGICNELNFDFFHEDVLYPDKYPEIYDTIKQIIKE